MNVVVAGSHGLIGTALVERLTERGDRVVRLVRGEAGPGEVAWNPAAGWVDRRALGRAGPVHAVVNLAGAGIGERRWTPAWRSQILRSRLQCTTTLVGLVGELDAPPAVMVNASAVGYYGDRGDEALTEDSGPGSGFLAEVCQSWEEAARPAASVTRLVIVRTGVVLARNGGALARQLPLFRLGLGGRLGSGRQFLSWITLRDELGVLVGALDDPALAGPVNAVAPGAVSNAEFTTALAHRLKRPALFAVPGVALELALGREMAHELLLVSQRVIPTALNARSHRFEDPGLEGALDAVLDDTPA